jgi:hypothetical protein
VTNETSGQTIRRRLHDCARAGSVGVTYMTCLAMMVIAAHARTLAGDLTETSTPATSNRTPSPTISTAAVPNKSTDVPSRNRTHLGSDTVGLSTEVVSAVVSVIAIRASRP